MVDLADEANGVKNEALHEIFEVSVVGNAAFLGKYEGDFVNNEVCLTNCEGDAENNEVRCEKFEGSAKKNEARCENCKDGAVKNEVRLENFEGDFVINEDRFELEEGFFRQDYRIIRIDSCVSSSVSSVLSVVNSASFGFISAQDPAGFRECLRSGWCAGGFCGRIGRRGFRRWRWGWQ